MIASPPPVFAALSCRPRPPPGTRALTLVAFAVLLGLQAVALVVHRTPLFEDDVLFFFRYADNLAAGHGYRFNAEEAPVWGASAPLWPLLIAGGEGFGLSAAQSCLLWSWVLALASTLLLGLVALRLLGPLAVLTLAPLLALNFLYSTWSTSGMESPLTFVLVSAALAVASGWGNGIHLGLVAGLCLVHKLDLAPLGLALLAGTALWRRDQLLRATLVAVGVAGAWYGFALWHFGSPLPNSFVRKLQATYGDVPRGWFARLTFGGRAGTLRTPLALLGVFALRRHPFVLLIALAQVLVPTLAYTVHPPSERFTWYAAAISSAIAFLAAGGLAFLLRASRALPPRAWQVTTAILLLAPLGGFLVVAEHPLVRGWHAYLERYTRLLMLAGLWVDEHAPADARVITIWGNPGYYSRRFVYDGSGLNRPPESVNLFEEYEPEVWIHCQFGRFADFDPQPHYRLAKLFEPTSKGPDFFVAVYFREEAEGPEPPALGPEPPAFGGEELGRFLARLQAAEQGRAVSTAELQQVGQRLVRKLARLSAAERGAILARWPELERLEERLAALPGTTEGEAPDEGD